MRACVVDELLLSSLLAAREPDALPPLYVPAFGSLSAPSKQASPERRPAICLQVFMSDSAEAVHDEAGSPVESRVNSRSKPALGRECHERLGGRTAWTQS
jgi:hypothetical protein